MSENESDFRRMLFRAMGGLCVCGRKKNKHGNVCCRMCRENYGSHSQLCEKRNKK